MKRFSLLSLPILVVLILGGTARAQSPEPPEPEPVVLTDDQGSYPLGLHLSLLEDPSGTLTIQEVSSPELAARFISSQVEVPNYGFTDSAYWARLTIRNETLLTDHWLLEVGFANMQFVDLYSPLRDGQDFAIKQTGVLRARSTRDFPFPRIILSLIISPQTQETFYLRFQNGASMTLPLTLWSSTTFLEHSLQDQILHGLFYGVLIGLLFYNLFLLFSLREANYLYFVILLASLIFEETSYDGYLALLTIPNLNFLTKYYMPLSFPLLIASMILFADSFLQLGDRAPKLHRFNLFILAVWGGLVLLVPFTRYHILALLMAPWSVLSLLAVLYAGFVSWRRGFQPARFFLIAWVGMLASILWVLFIRLGFVPSSIFSENAYRLGILWMVVCWSIALADRINLLKAETEHANRELSNSKHRLSQILEGLPIGVVVYGQDQKPHYGNRRTVEILSNPARSIRPDVSAGRTLAEAVEYYSFQVSGSHEPYPIDNIPVMRALKGEPSSVDDIEADLVERRVPLEIWASPVRDEAGNVESAVVAFQDITRRKQAETELEEYRKHLELLVEKRTAELNEINTQLSLEAAERRKLEKSLFERIEWLSALRQIHQTISGEADLPQVFDQLFKKMLALLSARIVFMIPWAEPGDRIGVRCMASQTDLMPDFQDFTTIFQEHSTVRKQLEPGKVILISAEEAVSLPEPIDDYFREGGFRTLVLAPLVLRHSNIGLLGVALSQPASEMNIHLIDLVEKMAFDLVELMEDAHLLEQSRALVATEERNRLARDLHDSVTQILFSASIVAEVLPQIWQRDPKDGLEGLQELRLLTRGALAEMRTLLIELRPAAIFKTPLSDLLTQLTEAATSRTELGFQLYIEKVPVLPAEVQISFYRVAQEALNNVTKHAEANRVSVSLIMIPPVSSSLPEDWQGNVKLVISDDGCGFATNSTQEEGLGLGIMRERASTINASLDITSQPGQGTSVTLLWCR